MPETPDFEQIAHSIAMSVPTVTGQAFILHRTHIAQQLRAIWNARGAADVATIETTLSSAMGAGAAAPYVENLVKTLDRAISLLDQ
jgi:hypothetical protein